MSSRRRALLALGSNIDPEKNLPEALLHLGRHPGIRVVGASSLYESPALGRPGDPPFRNAALAVETTLGPAELRQVARDIETALGRVRGEDRYAPRTIDIDLAAYEGFEGELGGSRVPDPEIALRAFLALPLAELAPHWAVGAPGRTLGEIAGSFDLAGESVRRLPGPGLAPVLEKLAPGNL